MLLDDAPTIISEDCEQSLFFLQLATGVRERLAAKPRDARNEAVAREEKRETLFSCLSRLQLRACAFSRVLLDRLRKRETAGNLSFRENSEYVIKEISRKEWRIKQT